MRKEKTSVETRIKEANCNWGMGKKESERRGFRPSEKVLFYVKLDICNLGKKKANIGGVNLLLPENLPPKTSSKRKRFCPREDVGVILMWVTLKKKFRLTMKRGEEAADSPGKALSDGAVSRDARCGGSPFRREEKRRIQDLSRVSEKRGNDHFACSRRGDRLKTL